MMRPTLATLGAALLTLTACSSGGAVVVQPQPGVVDGGADAAGSDRVWVCHQGRWQEVAAPAAEGHRNHGDRISTVPREPRSSC